MTESSRKSALTWTAHLARQEQDREDILREATALVERIELALPGAVDSLIVGFRRDGSVSLFVGADPVFQFNTQHQLRRAYVGGHLIKAERGQLVMLKRRRTATQVQLERTELDTAETAAMLAEAARVLQSLRDDLDAASFEILGQVPESVDLVGRVRGWLASIPIPLEVAARPHAG